MNINKNKHSFSLEVKERSAVTHFQMSTDPNETILIEGYLGEILSLKLIEDVVLEIEGSSGILRMDIDRQKLMKLIESDNRHCTK